MLDHADLPNDPEALKALVKAFCARASDAEARALEAKADAGRKGKKIEARDTRISQPGNMAVCLKRAMFGRKSEKIFHDDNQMVLEGILPELDESGAAPGKKPKRKPKPKRKADRGRLPKRLPRAGETAGPESAACGCRGAETGRIGGDGSGKPGASRGCSLSSNASIRNMPAGNAGRAVAG